MLGPEDEGIMTLRLDIYPTTQCNIPEDLNLQRQRCEKLKPHNVSHFYYNSMCLICVTRFYDAATRSRPSSMHFGWHDEWTMNWKQQPDVDTIP
jgi:hypothetical protein